MNKLGIFDVAVISEDADLTRYARRVMDLLAANKEMVEGVNSFDPVTQIRAVQLITETITEEYHCGRSAEELAAKIIKDATSAFAERLRLDTFSKAVYDIANRDKRYLTIYGRIKSIPFAADLLVEQLAVFTVQQFGKGISPEEAVDEFCRCLHDSWNDAERDALLRMPVEGTH